MEKMMTCKQTQQKAPSEEIMRRVQDNMMFFTTDKVQQPAVIMRDYKNLKMSFKTRVKIWLLNWLN